MKIKFYIIIMIFGFANKTIAANQLKLEPIVSNGIQCTMSVFKQGNDCIAITSSHCVKKDEAFSVKSLLSQRFYTVSKHSKKFGLAQIDIPSNHCLKMDEIKEYTPKIRTNSVIESMMESRGYIGDELNIFKGTLDNGYSLIQGEVINPYEMLKRKFFEYDLLSISFLPVFPGMSGGSIFRNDQLLGIIIGYSPLMEISYVVPVEQVRSFLENKNDPLVSIDLPILNSCVDKLETVKKLPVGKNSGGGVGKNSGGGVGKNSGGGVGKNSGGGVGSTGTSECNPEYINSLSAFREPRDGYEINGKRVLALGGTSITSRYTYEMKSLTLDSLKIREKIIYNGNSLLKNLKNFMGSYEHSHLAGAINYYFQNGRWSALNYYPLGLKPKIDILKNIIIISGDFIKEGHLFFEFKNHQLIEKSLGIVLECRDDTYLKIICSNKTIELGISALHVGAKYGVGFRFARKRLKDEGVDFFFGNIEKVR